jgi:hypothetical protein
MQANNLNMIFQSLGMPDGYQKMIIINEEIFT